MRPIIFALSGKSSVGKTSTIKLAYYKIMKEQGITYSKYTAINARDFVALVEISGHVVWFISQGDRLDLIKKHFNFLRRYRHDVIVCATRSKGETKNFIKKFQDMGTHDVNWRFLKKLDQGAQLSRQNKDAADIVKKISNLPVSRKFYA